MTLHVTDGYFVGKTISLQLAQLACAGQVQWSWHNKIEAAKEEKDKKLNEIEVELISDTEE
jgi:hypothetical protein